MNNPSDRFKEYCDLHPGDFLTEDEFKSKFTDSWPSEPRKISHASPYGMAPSRLSELIKSSVAKAKAAPSYRITPKHATLIEYTIQYWDCSTDKWASTQTGSGLEGFSTLKKQLIKLREEFPDRLFRIVSIVEVRHA